MGFTLLKLGTISSSVGEASDGGLNCHAFGCVKPSQTRPAFAQRRHLGLVSSPEGKKAKQCQQLSFRQVETEERSRPSETGDKEHILNESTNNIDDETDI
jgi:hypothetical protein